MPYLDPWKRRQASREWYARNRERALKDAARRSKRTRRRLQSILIQAKDQPCADCGCRYPHYVMDFDHVRGIKVAKLAQLATLGSETKLRKEMEKCEIVCANCHRERTYQREATIAGVPDDDAQALW